MEAGAEEAAAVGCASVSSLAPQPDPWCGVSGGHSVVGTPVSYTPTCLVELSYRPVIVAGLNSGKNHIIVTTIVNGVQTVYEGEPWPSPPLPNSLCLPIGSTACPTNSKLTGVVSSKGSMGLGTPFEAQSESAAACAAIAIANSLYNANQLNYVDNGAPNSNSYAYTLLWFASVLSDFGSPPPNTPGWGYNLLTNPSNYP